MNLTLDIHLIPQTWLMTASLYSVGNRRIYFSGFTYQGLTLLLSTNAGHVLCEALKYGSIACPSGRYIRVKDAYSGPFAPFVFGSTSSNVCFAQDIDILSPFLGHSNVFEKARILHSKRSLTTVRKTRQIK